MRALAKVMIRLAKILIPVDFSDNSLLAIRDAATLGRRFRSELMLLHVNELTILHSRNGPLGYGIAPPGAVRPDYMEQRRQRLQTFGVEETGGLTVKRCVLCGDAARIIVDRAQAEGVDLIVMPTHGYGPVRRLLLGSVTAKVLHDSDHPVWTSRPASEAARDISHVRHVMCAVNFRANDAKIIRWAAGLAAKFGATLTLAHAILPAPPEMPERYAFTWHDEARWGADERLRSLLRELEIPAEVLVIEGDAPIALGTAAKERGVDVLVIGRSQATNMIGRLGSHTYGIICHTPCPVVSL